MIYTGIFVRNFDDVKSYNNVRILSIDHLGLCNSLEEYAFLQKQKLDKKYFKNHDNPAKLTCTLSDY
ncbi:MAG TPA: hypothetical protein VIY08_01215 [Candidatus Nitrosocosmicus sp.]